MPGGFEVMDNIMDSNRDKTKDQVITSDVTGLVEILVGWLAAFPKQQPVGAFFGL